MKQSTNRILRTCILALACLFAISSARANILNTAKISLVETYRDRLVTYSQDGETYREVEEAPQTLVARIEASLKGTNTKTFTADTEFSVSIGGYSFSGALGDDPQFKRRRKTAVFPLGDFVELANGAEQFKRVGTVRVKWRAKKLVVEITCSDIQFAGTGEVGSSGYTDLAEPGVNVSGNVDPISISVALGDVVGETVCNVHVTSKTTLKKFWVPDYEDFEEFLLYSVRLQAGTRVPAGPSIGDATGGAVGQVE